MQIVLQRDSCPKPVLEEIEKGPGTSGVRVG